MQSAVPACLLVSVCRISEWRPDTGLGNPTEQCHICGNTAYSNNADHISKFEAQELLKRVKW